MTKKRVVIIGAGLAGGLASHLLHADPDFEVTVIEKGAKYGLNARTHPNDELSLVPTYCYGDGGTSNLWHNGLIIPEIEKINKLDLNDYINPAARLLGYKEELEFQEFIHTELMRYSDFNYDAIYYPLKKNIFNANFENGYFNSEITKINIHCNAVSSIEFNHKNKNKVIDVDILIISCGGIGTPRLLNKLGFIKKKMSFIDHPMGFFGKIKIKPQYVNLFSELEEMRMNAGGVKKALTCSIEGLKTALYFRPAITMDNKKSIIQYKSLLGASSGWNLIKNIFDFRLLHPDIISEVFSKLFGVKLGNSTFSMMLVCEQKGASNELRIDSARLKVSTKDMSIYKKHLEYYENILKKYAVSINVNTNIERGDFWSAAHYSGGDMFVDDVNELNLKYKNFENFYICDGSIIHTHSYTNTGLEIAARALKLARSLK